MLANVHAMTLINFLSRVHFADGVLEEALHSELEANGKQRPLIVSADERMSNLQAERFFSGFPRSSDPVVFTNVPPAPTESVVRDIADLYRGNDCDVLVAFGASHVIDLAKAARVAIAYDDPLHAMSASEGGSRRINGGLPSLYAVPSMLGFPAAANDQVRVTLEDGTQTLIWSRNLIPCIAICDPTLTLQSSTEEAAVAAASILSGAVDAFLSPRYHPPSDGLALDALRRLRINIEAALTPDNLPARRELMAAGLNNALSHQKGLRVIDALTNAVCQASDSKPQPGAVGGVVIAHLVKLYEDQDDFYCDPVKHILCIDGDEPLTKGLRDILSNWPVPDTLRELGVDRNALSSAADSAVKDFAMTSGPRNYPSEEIRKMLTLAH